MTGKHESIRVWDPFVRFFHWTLVLAFATAWATAEEENWLHEQAGYYILVLVGLRTLWGLIGSRHARFGDFLSGPAYTRAYLQGLRSGRPEHFVGHNPAGGWMVIALLGALTVTGLTGIMLDGREVWEELHELAANATLFLVGLHLAGVLFATVLHRENLIKAMWTGRKTREIPDV
ncbi:MAG: cytochrome b/b6 domain-containing protein [Pseudomonadota bacterium]